MRPRMEIPYMRTKVNLNTSIKQNDEFEENRYDLLKFILLGDLRKVEDQPRGESTIVQQQDNRGSHT